MKRDDQQILNAWTKAAAELNIKIHSPFTLTTDDGLAIEFLLLIEGFGSKLGTLIITLDDFDRFDIPEKHRYYCSALNATYYKKYNGDTFMDTLEDWRYFGKPELKPAWYAAKYEHDDQ